MSQQRLADLRPIVTSVADAIKVMGKIARIECAILLKKARMKKRITTIKAFFAEPIALDEADLQEFKLLLMGYINSNRHLFKRPRKIACDWGTFGLQKATEVVVHDEAALLKALVDKKLEDCFEVALKPVKKALKAHLVAGNSLPGCALHEGDTAVYNVADSLLKDARKVDEE